jgi:Polyketide cyclase / dehydrase and lipid transport
MEFECTVEVAAEPATVWAVMSDVERWPQWDPAVTAVERLDAGPLAVGSEARIRQPRLPSQRWRVTELEDGRAFVWEARSAGVRTVGWHRIAAGEQGRSVVTLGVRSTGALARVVDLFAGSLTRRYVAVEAEGLRRRSESAEGPAAGRAT